MLGDINNEISSHIDEPNLCGFFAIRLATSTGIFLPWWWLLFLF